MYIRRRALGLAIGLVTGSIILLTTWYLLLIGSPGKSISFLSKFFYGYSFSMIGGMVGFFWGFLCGLVGGATIAWLYNYLSKKIYKY